MGPRTLDPGAVVPLLLCEGRQDPPPSSREHCSAVSKGGAAVKDFFRDAAVRPCDAFMVGIILSYLLFHVLVLVLE